MKWTQEDLDYLIGNYSEMPTKQVEIALSRSKSAVWRKAKKLGLEKYLVDHEFFSEWSEEMAWVLGFWAADGCVIVRPNKTPEIQFCQSDYEIIANIKDVLSSSHKISSCKGNVGNPSYRLRYASQLQYDSLRSIFGCGIIRKSLTLEFPFIPHIYMRHFIRGYVDGDGCLSIKKTGQPEIQIAVGSEFFARDLQLAVLGLTGIAGRIYKRDNLFLVVYKGLKARCLSWWLYMDAAIFLKRKEKIARKQIRWEPQYIRRSVLTPLMRSRFAHLVIKETNKCQEKY